MGMTGIGSSQGVGEGRRWYFAGCEYDELSRLLKVQGEPVELSGKPLDLLVHLLTHQHVTVKKEDLMDAVWGDVAVTDESLKQAASRLRKALTGSSENVITTISGVGYRLAVPAECRRILPERTDTRKIHEGDPVPGRKHWRFVRALSGTASDGVWLITHEKTRELHVIKIAVDGVRLQALKREIAVSRLLQRLLGDRDDFVPILELSLDEPPYFSETQYCGQNLLQWAEGDAELPGELKSTALPIRVCMLIDLAKAVSAAHQVGVLHRDLKPANVLVLRREDGTWHVRVADFGVASIDQPSRLASLGITDPGSWGSSGGLSGSLMYIAPEVLDGEPSTTVSDVYALGIMLYQLVTGNFHRPISPGWEAEVEDPLLRQDIADAACIDPARRLKTAQSLVERLESLGARRKQRLAAEAVEARERLLTSRIAAARARRPWLIATVTVLLAGIVVSAFLYRRAVHQRDIAESINQFLSRDLLTRASPFKSGKPDESLVDAIEAASPEIDHKFASDPSIAADLHHTIARALDNRTSYDAADREYARAASLFIRAEGPLSQNAMIAQLQRAGMQGRRTVKGALAEANLLYAQQQLLIAKLRTPREELPAWNAYAHGMILITSDNAAAAAAVLEQGIQTAQSVPGLDPTVVPTMKRALVFAYIRLGEGKKAEPLTRELIVAATKAGGPNDSSVLMYRMNLAQELMTEQKNAEAIREATAVYPLIVASLGPQHELVMTTLGVRAQAEGDSGLFGDAARDSLAMHGLAAGKQPYLEAASLSDAGLSECRAGRYTTGEAHARAAVVVGDASLPNNRGLHSALAFSLATCLIGTGQLSEAQHLLDGIDVVAASQASADADWGADVQMARADIAFQQKDYGAAAHDLAMAKVACTDASAPPIRAARYRELSAKLQKVSPRALPQ